MRKLLLMSTAVLICTAAHASDPVDEIVLSCKPSLDRKDPNPVTAIHVILDIGRHTNKLLWMNVIHERFQGDSVYRFQQYEMNWLGTVYQDKMQYGWDGFLSKDHNIKMVGDTWWNNDRKQWYYRERQYKINNHQITYDEISLCVTQDPGEPIGDPAVKYDKESKGSF